MSLDVSLIAETPVKKQGTGVFIRENGKTVELTPEQVAEKFPGSKPAPLYTSETDEVYTANITHNLGKMADAVGIYYALWRPDERGWSIAADIIEVLEDGLKELKANPETYKLLNPENGWGSYEDLVEFTENYLAACRKFPTAKIEVSR